MTRMIGSERLLPAQDSLDATRWSNSVGLRVKCTIDPEALLFSKEANPAAWNQERLAAACMSLLHRVRRELEKGVEAPIRFHLQQAQQPWKRGPELVAAFESTGAHQTLVIKRSRS